MWIAPRCRSKDVSFTSITLCVADPKEVMSIDIARIEQFGKVRVTSAAALVASSRSCLL